MSEKWEKLEDVNWPGREVWMFKPWDNCVDLTWLPPGYSRDPKHCGGILVQLARRPLPPRKQGKAE